MDEGNLERQVPLTWVDVDDVPVFFANQFIIQHHQDEFILTIGQMVPPPLIGTIEEREDQLEQLDFVPVKPLARIAFTRARLLELVQALAGNGEIYDRTQQVRDEQMRGGDAP